MSTTWHRSKQSQRSFSYFPFLEAKKKEEIDLGAITHSGGVLWCMYTTTRKLFETSALVAVWLERLRETKEEEEVKEVVQDT